MATKTNQIKSNDPLGFLEQDSTEQVHLPAGGDFSPSGIIALWNAKILFSFYSDVDLSTFEDPPKSLSVRKMGSGWRYYYASNEDAKAAGELAGQQYAPQQVWHFEAKKDSVLNFANEEALAKFNDVIAYDVDVFSLQSSKRHAFQLIALPAAVATVAKSLGFETSGFDLSELSDQNTIYSDELQAALLGAAIERSARNKGGKAYTDFDYTNGALWGRRAQLWKELGEEDPTHYTVGQGNKRTDTTSDKLARCLRFVTSPWPAGFYLRVITVSNPKVDAVYGEENKRLTIPVITELFRAKADAQTAADADKARSTKSIAIAHSNGNLQVPEQWTGMETEWSEAIATLKSEIGDKPLPMQRKIVKERASSIGATDTEILAWLQAA